MVVMYTNHVASGSVLLEAPPRSQYENHNVFKYNRINNNNIMCEIIIYHYGRNDLETLVFIGIDFVFT